MIPSRGLHALRRIAPHVRIQTRNISIARASPVRSQLRVATPCIDRPSIIATTALASANFRRHASTTPSPQPDTIINATPSSRIDTLTLDDIDFSAPGISTQEGIGYLKEIGLDYGWGPTAVIQWTIEHLHIWAGLPWWGSIAVAAALFRVLTFPLFLRSSATAAKVAALHTVLDPINDRLKQYQKEGNKDAMLAEYRTLSAVRSQAGINYLDTFYPVIVQGVVGFCGFKLLRAMSVLPVPGLKDGGIAWLTDLTVPDGYLIIPALIAILTHLLTRIGGESGGVTPEGRKIQQFMFYGLPLLVFVLTIFQSGALCVWFAISTSMAVLQALTLRSNNLRGLFGLPPTYKKPKSAQATGTAFVATESSRVHSSPTYQAPSLRKTASSIGDSFNQYTKERKEQKLKELEVQRKKDAIKKAFEKRRQR